MLTAGALLGRGYSTALRWAFTSRRDLENAGGDAPIAKTLDCDLGLLPRYLANPRSAGHAALNFETQSLGGRLGIGRNGKVDEIGHGDLPVSELLENFGATASAASLPYPHDRSEAHISRHRHKESI
jgi:hypothetical protein